MMLRRIPRSMLMPVSNLSQFSSLVTTTPKILNDKNDFQGMKTRKYQTTRPLLLSSQDDSSLSYSERQGTYFSVTINSLFHTETFVFTVPTDKLLTQPKPAYIHTHFNTFSIQPINESIDRSAKKGRPVSPHVQVYAFPITAISSITNRVTGVALSVGVTGIGCITLLGGDAPMLMSTIGSSVVGPLAKIVVSFPLVYHYLGGVRHYLWDNDPEMLGNEAVTKSSYYLFGATGAITLMLGLV